MVRGPLPALAVLAAALLVGCSSSYHAGDQAAREWEAWVKDHPLAGAEVTDTTGTNVQPFQGAFEADARLTAAPSESAIVTAMASMCRFDKETSSSTTYWLNIGTVWLQAPCKDDQQQKVAQFWTAVHELPGITELDFSTEGIALDADDASLTTLVPAISEAADASGWATSSSVNKYSGKHVTITQDKGADLSAELGLTQGVLDTVGAEVKKVEVVAGRVSVSTKGTVTQAEDWQRTIGNGNAALTVTPNRITTEVAFSDRGRTLLDRLADDSRVLAVNVIEPFWEIETVNTQDARSLITTLTGDPAATDLGHLQFDVGPSNYDSATGKGRMCFVRPDFAKPTHAAALLDLCDIKDAVEVDDRFDAGLDLRLHSTDLKPALACLKRAPFGLPVYLQLPQGETREFTTGKTLGLKYSDSPASSDLEKIWDSLPGQ